MFNFRHIIDLICTLISNAVLLNKISYAIVVFNFRCTFFRNVNCFAIYNS